jgi:hypothetical protein
MRRGVHHRERAEGVHPALQGFLDAWIAWAAAPFPLVVCPEGGVRTNEAKQSRLYAAGKSKARTLADTPHGRGAALDVAPYRRNAVGLFAPDYRHREDFAVIGEFAEGLGLAWGGRFPGFFDGPHVQLPEWRSYPYPPRPEVVVGSPAPSPSVVIRQPLALVAPPVGPEVVAMSLTPPPAAEVSPTGAPTVPQQVIKFAGLVVGAAALALQVLPEHTIAFKICAGIVSFGAVLGIYSQGARKKS